MTVKIAIQNRTTVLNDQQVLPVVQALQIQLDRDFEPVWRLSATLEFFNRNQTIPEDYWVIYLLDDSTIKGALGYHAEHKNAISAKVFVKTANRFGYSWTVTLSHEVMEMLVNPYVNLSVFRQTNNTNGTIYFYEVADPCQADNHGYKINDILVSDFVYPTWFDLTHNGPGTKYDFCGRITSPFQILRGGYMSIFRVSGRSGWSTITQNNVPLSSKTSLDRNRLQRKLLS